MTKLFCTASTIAMAGLLTMGPALAQEATTGDQQTGGSERAAGEITCRELVAMDTASVPGVLYYIAGHRAGQQSGMTGGAGQEGAGAASAMATHEGAGSQAEAGGDAEMAAGGDAEMAAGGDAEMAAGGDAEMAAGEAGGTSGNVEASGDAAAGSTEMAGDASGSGAAGGDAAGQAGGDTMEIVRVAGFFEIPIERTMIACSEAPENRAADVIEQQQDGSGTDSESGSSN